MSLLWETVSKAFWKSKNTQHISLFWSSCVSQSCVVESRAVKVDFPFWNPHCASESGWCSLRWSVINEWKCFSRSLLSIDRRDIGLYPDGLCLVVDLGIGTTLAAFHSLGKWPFAMDRLKIFVKEGAMLSDVALSMRAEIPSGPLAL